MPARGEAPARVWSYPRDVFVHDVWDYSPGEHVSMLGPTGAGKTQLAYQLIAATATRDLPAVVLAMKPRDETVSKFSKRHRFRIVRDWPPRPTFTHPGRQAGYVLWPTHSMDPDADDERHEAVFRRCLRRTYLDKGDWVVFADEVYSLCEELNLTKDLRRIWTKGRSMGAGLWGATQKPTHVPLWMYNQAHHLFLAYDPDEAAQKRFAEIGGVDPVMVRSIVARLPQYHWLYIRRADRSMCVVQA